MNIEVYCFEDRDGNASDFTTQDPNEAREFAQKHGLKWIAQTFKFSDSELVEDYTDLEN